MKKWYILLTILLFLYSFTQVDLNLTLSRVSVWQSVQKYFLQIGYYQRPLSTGIYLFILVCFFFLYVRSIGLIRQGKLSVREVWEIIVVLAAILLFSYPAFSYDLFNYMFTAKTVVLYHKNPYEVIPLQFAGFDPWLTFLRWTHLPSAYTPLWILFTLPAYVFGFGYFLLIMWSIKLLAVGAYLLTALGLVKILECVNKKYVVTGLAIFAFNPLIIIETLVNGHNDILMMAAAVWAVYMLVKKRFLFAFFLLSVSIALKLMTIVLIPLFVYAWWKGKITYEKLIRYSMVLLTTGLLLVISQREVLPWYLVWIIPFVALLPAWSAAVMLSIGASAGLLLRYAPIIYYGHYNEPLQLLKTWLTIVSIAIFAIIAVWQRKWPTKAHSSS